MRLGSPQLHATYTPGSPTVGPSCFRTSETMTNARSPDGDALGSVPLASQRSNNSSCGVREAQSRTGRYGQSCMTCPNDDCGHVQQSPQMRGTDSWRTSWDPTASFAAASLPERDCVSWLHQEARLMQAMQPDHLPPIRSETANSDALTDFTCHPLRHSASRDHGMLFMSSADDVPSSTTRLGDAGTPHSVGVLSHASEDQPSGNISDLDMCNIFSEFDTDPKFARRGSFSVDDLYMGQAAAHAAPSESSVGSTDSLASSASAHVRKRRRRQPMIQRTSTEQKEKRKYQCTFCTDTFKTKYDWQRHETTVHLSLERWHCTRFGPLVQNGGGIVCCAFCTRSNPTADHLESHNYTSCLNKPPEERIFRRKDHFRQHLRLFHNGCMFQNHMEGWLSSIDTVHSRCGFCDAQMTTWTERQRHLAHHFRSGTDMKDWKGDRGFDEQIDKLVENDMPVFLIGDQRNTLEPFSASQADHRIETPVLENIHFPRGETASATQSTQSTPHPWPSDTSVPSQGMHSYRRMEALLLAYVSEELSHGRVPSDRQLQKRTSEIIFGPNNDWDQTWADNPQWLELFRKKAGLISLPLSGGKNAFVGYDAT